MPLTRVFKSAALFFEIISLNIKLPQMKTSTLLPLLLLLISSLQLSAKLPEYRNPTPGEFPILAWYSIVPDSAQTKERYQELREAGFNISSSHSYRDYHVLDALKASEGTGVKIMAKSNELYSDTKNSVEKFMSHPGLAGYFLIDEPLAKDFPDLKAFRDRIMATDSTHLLYLNLFPANVSAEHLGTKSYENYIERFVNEVQLPFISFDFYPIVENPKDGSFYWRPIFYENYEIISRVAKRHGIPFWAFCLSTAHDPYPIPTSVHLRCEAFTALAYGAQCIQYFTYWQPISQKWNFHHAPIDETGKRTDTYYLVRDLNREIQALSNVFLGAMVDDVSHTGKEIPQGTKRLTSLPKGFGEITSDGEGVMVSQFHNGNDRYLMILNRDIHHAQKINLQRPQGIKKVNPDGKLSADSRDSKIVIAPGDYVLYKL